MKNLFKILLLLFLVLTFLSCRTTYKINSDKVKRISDRRILRHVISNYVEYSGLAYKFNGEYSDSGKTVSFNGNLRIKKDSVIWISISVALGIELARIQIRPDSVFFMNKIKDEYFINESDYISNLFQVDIDYDILQSILTNEIFLYADDDETANSRREEVDDDEPEPGLFRKTFIADTDSNLYVLKTYRKRKLKKHIKKNRPEIIMQSFRIIPDIYKIQSVCINEISEKRELNISYSNFMAKDSIMMPYSIKMDIKDRNRIVSLSFNFSKITVNPDVSFPFNIPEKYKPIETKRQ